MTPLQLTLKGFIGIRSGLNREEVTIDFDALAGDAQLVAIVGHNGAGKSTILDNVHPFRVMPSRAGGYGPTSFSYYDQTYGTEAKKELTWDHDGACYRSIILIKNSGKTRKQECYLQKLTSTGQWAAATLADGTPCDGKTEAYDRAIEEILGTPEMFFTAAFACQGRRTLADYPNGDIKALMSDLLGLERYQNLSTQAREVVKALTNRKAAMSDRVARMPVLRARLDTERNAAADERVEIASLEIARDAAVTAQREAARRLAEAQSAHAESAQTERRRDTLKAQLRTAEEREQADMESARSSSEAGQNGVRQAISLAKRSVDRAALDLAEANRALADARHIIGQRDSIEAAAQRLSVIDAEIAAAREAVTAAEQGAKEYQEARNAQTLAESELQSIQREGHAIKDACQSLRDRAGLIDDVPCKGTDLQGRCKLLAEANTAATTLPAKEEELEAKRAERTAAAERIESAAARVAETIDAVALLIKARAAAHELEDEARRLTAVAAAKASLDEAVATEAALARNVDACHVLHREALVQVDSLEADLLMRADALKDQLGDIAARALAEKQTIQTEIDALPPTNTEQLLQAEETHRTAEAAVLNQQSALEMRRQSVARHDASALATLAEIESLADDVRRAERLDVEIAHYTVLSKALGRDGIVALCIDDAGPTLASIANDLLTACYGPRFTVAIQTQEETASGTVKETFDIRVFDAERDDVKSVSAVSGGERIWINEAMTRAIALYQAQSSGRSYGCLFSDESDGALDPQKKRQFVDMKRKVLELGGYRREFFISHTPAIVEVADAVIDLSTLKAA